MDVKDITTLIEKQKKFLAVAKSLRELKEFLLANGGKANSPDVVKARNTQSYFEAKAEAVRAQLDEVQNTVNAMKEVEKETRSFGGSIRKLFG